jgi:hypothetical protein
MAVSFSLAALLWLAHQDRLLGFRGWLCTSGCGLSADLYHLAELLGLSIGGWL